MQVVCDALQQQLGCERAVLFAFSPSGAVDGASVLTSLYAHGIDEGDRRRTMRLKCVLRTASYYGRRVLLSTAWEPSPIYGRCGGERAGIAALAALEDRPVRCADAWQHPGRTQPAGRQIGAAPHWSRVGPLLLRQVPAPAVQPGRRPRDGLDHAIHARHAGTSTLGGGHHVRHLRYQGRRPYGRCTTTRAR